MTRCSIPVLVAAVLAVLTTTAVAATIHVPADHPTIQAGIDAAVDGDEVVVAPGIYLEVINFQGKAIILRKGEGEGAASIDAHGWWTSTVTCANGEGPDTIIDGFWIKGGRGTVWGGSRYGGGMFISGSSPTVRNCTFSGNTADAGGGLCTVTGSATIVNCIFAGNSASISDGGGGMYNYSSSPKVVNCEFISNSSVSGGGMTNMNAVPQIVNCLFRNNVAAFGAGMRNENASPTLINCTFAKNTASSSGGAIKSTSAFAQPVIRNSIFWGNNAPFGPEILDQTGAASTVEHSTVDGGWDGTGENNDTADPMFVDTGAGNLRLQPGSPCIDTGVNEDLLFDLLDLDGNARVVGIAVDRGAYETQDGSAAPCPADLNGDGTVDIGDIVIVMSQWGDCPDHCVGDLNDDDVVDFDDLVIVLTTWGDCP